MYGHDWRRRDGLKPCRRAGMKGWIHKLVYSWRDSGQAPFHYSEDECERVGAYGDCVYVSVCVGVHMLVFIMIASFVCLWACMCCVCRPLYVCAGVYFRGCVHCVLGWVNTPALAAPGSRGIREVAPLKWSSSICEWECVFMLFCGRISDESGESCYSRAWKENWIRLLKILAAD